jgi:xylulokinase
VNRFLIGIDVGTGSARSMLFDLSGNLLAHEVEAYPLYRPQATWAEQEPNDWWKAVKTGLQDLLGDSKIIPESIMAIGVCGQTNGHVLVDSHGQSLGRAIIWQDRRATAEADEVKEKLSRIDMAKYLGTHLPIDASTIPPRMLWLQRNVADKVAKAVSMLQPKDFINFRLTAKLATDWASCKTIIDLRRNLFHDEYFSYLGLERRLIPPAFPPHAIIGRVSDSVAKETGLACGTPVVAGCIDAWCNVLGSGAVFSGIAADVAGSSEVITVFSDYGADNNQLNVIPSFDGYLFNAPTQSGGDSLKWFLENFNPPQDLVAGRENDFALLNQIAAQVQAGAGGLIFVPYLQGERAPIWDSNARGMFVGITKKHGYPEFVRSIFEGVAYSIHHVLDTVETVGGFPIEEIRISGSGAQSMLWNQIKADITGKLVQIPKVLDTGCLGAALIAGVGVGCYSSYAVAAESAVQINREYHPNLQSKLKYRNLYNVYRQIYPNMKEVFLQLSLA